MTIGILIRCVGSTCSITMSVGIEGKRFAEPTSNRDRLQLTPP
jgi:hypothetical protein